MSLHDVQHVLHHINYLMYFFRKRLWKSLLTASFTNLCSGDVIVTGTPGGVGDKRNPPVYMKPGDVVEVDIGPVGVLKNFVIEG